MTPAPAHRPPSSPSTGASLHPAGQSDEQLMKDLIRSQQPPVAPGKARRKKDKTQLAAERRQPLDKSKGFARR